MQSELVASNEQELEEALSEPYDEDVGFARRLVGDVIVLGAGGKMGPTLVRRIARSIELAGGNQTVYAASRFSEEGSKESIESAGARAIEADLMDDGALAELPDCSNVIYLVGMKFGGTEREPMMWALNAYLPGRVSKRFSGSRIVALSTGNIYPRVRPGSGGCSEETEPSPLGEYAQSCLGRERVFQHFSSTTDTPLCLIRLNYAVEARYGVFLDIAQLVNDGQPIPLEIGYVNTIWQGDANSACFRALEYCESPANILNVSGPEELSVRQLAEEFGRRLGREPVFAGTEGDTALLSNSSRYHGLMGPPKVSPDEVVDLVADWIMSDRAVHGKPTKFEVSDGKF